MLLISHHHTDEFLGVPALIATIDEHTGRGENITSYQDRRGLRVVEVLELHQDVAPFIV